MIDSDTLHDLLASDRYQPVDASGLARKLKIKDTDKAAFLTFLADEEREGRVVAAKHGHYALPERLGLLAGRIAVNERGFGFVIPDDPDHADVRIAGGNLGTAMHNDRVLIRLHSPGGRGFGKGRQRREEKPEGEVTRVLKRARTQLVGTLERSKAAWYVRPDDARILHDVCVPPPFDDGKPVPVGFKVVAKLKEWTSPHMNPEGEVVEVLGPPNQAGIDILSIIRKHELPGEFPAAALAEADRIPDAVRPSDLEGREDFRNDFVLTIDPDDAKDFDDALSYKVLPDGDLEVAIHIADVSHYVRPGGALDAEARVRGNSVYLVDRVIPMLPEKLSNGLCSLRPDVDRLVKSVVVRLGRNGRVNAVRFTSGVIHSKKRLTYQEAYKLIQKPAGPLGKHLEILGRMAQTLRRARFAQGALNLDFPEVKVRLDASGKPTAIEKNENDESHQLIEEYMLLANECVARKLTQEGRPAVHRVHETPDPDRLRELRVQLISLGVPVGDLTQRGEIGKLLDRATGTPEEAVVKTNLLRSLKRAVYSEKPLGHFGLAKKNYAHFTSPIRRYADLVVHRALFGKPKPLPAKLGQSLSELERRAAEAEMESVKLKKLEFFAMEAQKTETKGKGGRPRVFPALVLEVKSGGLVVDLPDFSISGFVPVGEMEGDFYDFDPARQEMRGQSSRTKVAAGMTIGVHVVTVDLGRRRVDFGTTRQSLTAHASHSAPAEAPRERAPQPRPGKPGRPVPKPSASSGAPPRREGGRREGRGKSRRRGR